MECVSLSQTKLYLITSAIAAIVLLINYLLGLLFLIMIMLFPFIWIGIYKLLLYFVKKRSEQHELHNKIE